MEKTGGDRTIMMPEFDNLTNDFMKCNNMWTLEDRLRKLEGEIAYLKPLVLSLLADVEELKKAR